MDDDSHLTDREKELKKWNQPYEYHEFPKMLFRGMRTPAGTVEREDRVVHTVAEETLAKAEGWFNHPQAAIDAVNSALREQQDLERQAADRHQAELIEQAISKVLDRRHQALETRSEGTTPVPATLAPPVPTTEEGTDTPADRTWFEPLVRQRGHTINSLAAKVECNSGTLYKWRDGHTRRLRPDDAEKVAKELGLDPKVFA